jgi:hypothetical protein
VTKGKVVLVPFPFDDLSAAKVGSGVEDAAPCVAGLASFEAFAPSLPTAGR